jgi:large subunit ribosomal protein L29
MKQIEITQLADADLKSRIGLYEEQLSKMKLSHKVTPMENPLQITALRKSVARLHTELTKRNTQA